MFADHAADNDFVNDFTQFFAQDQWTVGRLTLQGGIRFEYIRSFYPEAVIGQDRFVPQTLVFRRRMLASVRKTSTRGSVSRMTCSGTERRRSSSVSVDTRRLPTPMRRTADCSSPPSGLPRRPTACGTTCRFRLATRVVGISLPIATC